ERRVRTFFANDDVRLELLNQALGRLCRRQRPAARIFILNRELVAVDTALVELLQRKFNALFVLRAEIRARPGHRKQCTDLDVFILRMRRVTDRQKTDRRHAYKESTKLRLHFSILPNDRCWVQTYQWS